jgi:hypothetical protein
VFARSVAGQSDATLADRLIYLVGVAGLAASIVVIFLGMRAVLDIGGFCAEGGPYEIETHCPDGVPLLMMLGLPAVFLFGGLMVWRGQAIGSPYQGAVFVAWPALFLSLGWNFLEYGFFPPGGAGQAWGWLICGVVFVVMGAVPLWIVLRTDGVPRRPQRDSLPWLGAIGAAVVVGIGLGYGLFKVVAG